MFCVLCILMVVLAPGCGDDTTTTDAGLDASSDGITDGEVPFTLEQGGPGHADVSAALSQGQARAGRVTVASQLLQGIKVTGRVGDYKLYNQKVGFIIRDERWSDGYSPFGGELLDGARVDQVGAAGTSLLGETVIGAGVQVLEPTSVGVVADGSDGKAAIVRAIGELSPMPVLQGLLGAMLGGKVAAHLVIDYVLEPDSDVLEIRWRVFNKTTAKQEILLVALGLLAGDGAEFFADRAGFDVQKAPKTDWVGIVSPEVSYVLYSPDQPLAPIVTYEGLWVQENGSLDVPAAGEGRRTFHLGLTDGEPEAAWRMARRLKNQPEPAAVSGKVVDASSAVVAGARVHVQLDDGKGTYVTRTDSGSDGTYSVALPPGKYLLSAIATGYDLATAVKLTVDTSTLVQDIALGHTASMSYAVTDGDDAALPSKVVFQRASPPPPLPASFGEPSFAGKATLMVFASDGSGTAKLPPGDYTVTASRGFEYEIDSATVTLAGGETKNVALKLVRSVDTTGFMCGDFHVHAMWSPDSSDLYEMKVAALAAEGVELPVITDHEYISDLGPYITKLALQKWVQGVVGEELTTFVYGHFNPFPITANANQPNNGAMLWYGKDPGTLFADVRKTWPDAVLQINHPRGTAIKAYFSYADYDPTTGTSKGAEYWSTNFDAVEAFNGSGWSANKGATVLDWFSFLDRGLLVTATGNSDNHHAYTGEVGYPRNYVELSTDSPGSVSMAELGTAVKEQRVLVSGGPFVTVSVGGKGMGEVADATTKVMLKVKVQAPTWMPVDALRVFVGGQEVHSVTLDATTADPTNPVVRYDGELELAPTKDSWVVVVVTGNGTLDPVSRNDEPFALTNPIYLDVDGNKAYDPPLSF